MRFKLLMCATGLAYGGAETQLVQLALRLRARGWQVSIVSLLPPAAYADVLAEHQIAVHSLWLRRKVPDPRAIVRLARIVRQERPLIVHAHMIHANLLARVTRLVAPMPVLICTAHSVNEGGYWRMRAYRWTDYFSDVTTQICYAGRDEYLRLGVVPPHKLIVVPNGVDTCQFQPCSQTRFHTRLNNSVCHEFVWLAVGRLDEPKDYETLLCAFRVVRQRHPQSRLWIVGDGPLRQQTIAQARDLGVHDAVKFWGVRNDVPALMNAADGYVMSSRWEGMPMVLLEAQACGVPVVATNVGGVAEVVRDGETGFLVPPSNPEALADAMLRLMALPEAERRAMGQAGRMHTMANFDLEKVVDKWEQLYLQLLERKGLVSTRNPQSESC